MLTPPPRVGTKHLLVLLFEASIIIRFLKVLLVLTKVILHVTIIAEC